MAHNTVEAFRIRIGLALSIFLDAVAASLCDARRLLCGKIRAALRTAKRLQELPKSVFTTAVSGNFDRGTPAKSGLPFRTATLRLFLPVRWTEMPPRRCEARVPFLQP